MKTVLTVLVAAVCCTSLYASANKAPKLTPEEKAKRDELRLKMTGGFITQPGKGKILIVNAQNKFSEKAIEERMAYFKGKLQVAFESRRGTWKLDSVNPPDAQIVVYAIDDGNAPMSLVALEGNWGAVNVARIENERQFGRELTRILIASMGGIISRYQGSAMQPVGSAKDLDSLVGCDLTVDALVGIKANFKKLGITAERFTVYKKACQEGWAPSPTNEYQKAIWDEVHKIPTKPIKIEFDPKTDTK